MLRVLILGLCSLRASSAIAESLTRKAATATTTLQAPNEYGTVDYTVTTIPAAAFTYQSNDGYVYGDCACTSYQCACFNGAGPWEFYAGVNIPAGAVIDYVGLQSYSKAEFQTGVALYVNGRHGTQDTIVTYSSSAHGWDTDYNAVAIGYQLPANVHNALVAHVELAPGNQYAYFAWVEIWWHRTVSPGPATATFADVPTDHFFFQYVEALVAAGITAGYGNGQYGVNDPITRGQMAVFLAKALGLHWPY